MIYIYICVCGFFYMCRVYSDINSHFILHTWHTQKGTKEGTSKNTFLPGQPFVYYRSYYVIQSYSLHLAPSLVKRSKILMIHINLLFTEKPF